MCLNTLAKYARKCIARYQKYYLMWKSLLVNLNSDLIPNNTIIMKISNNNHNVMR